LQKIHEPGTETIFHHQQEVLLLFHSLCLRFLVGKLGNLFGNRIEILVYLMLVALELKMLLKNTGLATVSLGLGIKKYPPRLCTF